MSPPGAAVTVGGKDSSLTPASVYAVASAQSRVQIDSSALEKLSQTKKPPLPPPESTSSNPSFLSPYESRAALLVLLNKLLRNKLLCDSAIRPSLPLLIEETLNQDSGHDTLDFSSPVALLNSLCALNGKKKLNEIGVTGDEIGVVGSSCATSIGVCAILDCCCSALVRVSDAVVALSCEAARGDMGVFDLPEGVLNKDEIDTARDMKDLLLGSKLASQVVSEAFGDVPAVHGGFKEVVRSLHVRARNELNSTVKTKKGTGVGNVGKEEDLLRLLVPLALSILSMCRLSLGRARLSAASISGEDLRSKVVESFKKGCPNLEMLRDQCQSIVGKVPSGSDNTSLLHLLYGLFVNFREVIAWEAALALFALETDDSIEKIQVGHRAGIKDNGENAKGEKKSEKKKKKILGKGTSVVRHLLRDQLSSREETSFKDDTVLIEWVKELKLYFDPQYIALNALLGKLKEILESNDSRRLPKIPKGTRDFGKEQMTIRERAFAIIVRVFKMHGATALDTPVFELRETLMGKYGEDSKLIYDLADQGGELCSLRYDLTVPFARYLAMNNLNALKRYQIAKVYRRDNPSKGRYREFYQCDFDIAGQYGTMEPDFEVVKVLTQLLDRLEIGEYEIKLNHRKLLDGMLEICGVSSEKFRTVCSSIDKLDKQPFEQIKKELVEEKGLAVDMAEKIGTFVGTRGPPLEILSKLKKEGSQFLENNASTIALDELEILFKALERSKCLNKVVFDLSLARGLDYYTGVIFEAVFKGATQVGSIAAGGRYDNLVGMFSGKQVPAVGVSLGIERVFTIMEQLEKDRNQVIRATETQVLVAILGKDVELAAELVSELWDSDISAEYGITKRVTNHIRRALESRIPWMVIVGESEVNTGMVKLKDMEANLEYDIPRGSMVDELRKRLNIS